jgi:hypothetical protein
MCKPSHSGVPVVSIDKREDLYAIDKASLMTGGGYKRYSPIARLFWSSEAREIASKSPAVALGKSMMSVCAGRRSVCQLGRPHPLHKGTAPSILAELVSHLLAPAETSPLP